MSEVEVEIAVRVYLKRHHDRILKASIGNDVVIVKYKRALNEHIEHASTRLCPRFSILEEQSDLIETRCHREVPFHLGTRGRIPAMGIEDSCRCRHRREITPRAYKGV